MVSQSKLIYLRNNIVSAAHTYKDFLAGKYYIYIFDNQYFEMYYGIENFLHLTGVGSKVNNLDFYHLAVSGQLTTNQFYFDNRHPYSTANKKAINLINLDRLIQEDCFVIKDINTQTSFYPYSITNIDQSLFLGLDKKEYIHIPKSFRVKGNIFAKTCNENIFDVDYIYSKTDKEGLYNNLLYSSGKDIALLDEKVHTKIETK